MSTGKADARPEWGVWERIVQLSWIATVLLLPTAVPAMIVGGWALRVADASFVISIVPAWLLRRRLGVCANTIVTAVGTAGALLQLSVPPSAVTTIIPAEMVRVSLILFAGVGIYATAFLGGRVGLGLDIAMLIPTVLAHPVGFIAPSLAFAIVAILGFGVHAVVVHLITRHAELEARHAELEAAAYRDPLTGLGNRRALEAAFHAQLAAARQRGASLFVSIWDLDDLKGTNDELGHEAGDALLRSFATALVATLHPEDRVFRLGGDEFCCLHVGLKDGGSILARMLLAFPGVSGGFAEVVSESLSDALASADREMYRAKRRRRRRDGFAG